MGELKVLESEKENREEIVEKLERASELRNYIDNLKSYRKEYDRLIYSLAKIAKKSINLAMDLDIDSDVVRDIYNDRNDLFFRD